MGKDDKNNSEIEKALQDQETEIAFLKNEIKKLNDPNSEARIIQKGKQVHPKFEKNKVKVAATLPKSE